MPKKILLADDSITIQKVVELTFSDGDYEVTAVNNGAKAVQKLAEMRPDIILSDIIMPEKNGYEVCEYVKSHPEYRSIPVVLLTGTFEPFDPDRAEKAGCDAVVTKPFESQSLIHKVEELIAASQQSAPSPAAAASAPPLAAPEPAASPWLDETPVAPPPPPPPPAPAAPISPFSTATEAVPALNLPFTHDADVFGAPPSQQAGSADMPFETPADQSAESPFGAPPDAEQFSGETRAFTKMSFDDMPSLQSAAPPPPPAPDLPPPAPEPSPWDEPADASPFGQAPAPAAQSPFNEPEPEYSGETRAFQKMDFEEMNRMAATPPPAPAPEPEADAPFGAPPDAEAFSGETRAFTKMSFDDLQKLAASQTLPPEPEAPAPPSAGGSLWDQQEPASFSAPVPQTPAWEAPAEPAWSPEPEPQPEAAAPALEELPVPQSEPEPPAEPEYAAPTAVAPSSEPALPIAARDLSDEQIDRIARRVVELMSDQVVRNIAWEVIPDLAEMVVKERIRQLESEA